MSETFLDFIDRTNEAIETLETVKNKVNNTKNSVDFLSKTIVPRLSQRPAVFESLKAMQESPGLVDGDICMTFLEPIRGPRGFVGVFKIKPRDYKNGFRYDILNTDLAAYEIRTTDNYVELANDLETNDKEKALGADQGVELKKLIEDLNKNLRASIKVLESTTIKNTDRVNKLETALYNDITGNPFIIEFSSLEGIKLTRGVYNAESMRLEC